MYTLLWGMDLYFLWWFLPVPMYVHLWLVYRVQRLLGRPEEPGDNALWTGVGVITAGATVFVPSYLLSVFTSGLRLCGTALGAIEPFGWLAILSAVALPLTLVFIRPTSERRTALTRASICSSVLFTALFVRFAANLDMGACRLNPGLG